MAEPTQYSFDLSEMTAALIKQQDIHEGLWQIGFEVIFGAGLVGPTPAETKPGAIMQINKGLLIRQTAGTPEATKAVDATIVNPARKKVGSCLRLNRAGGYADGRIIQ